ncbi:MAG: acetamidase/formamidase family protein [Spirochaetales bacterium]|nr:acetamidase/formamidase family protein [Spirochaetales bacterium]
MQEIKRTDVIFQFGPNNPPIATVRPGETVSVETDDCFRSQIRSEKDLVTQIDFSEVNPATGPIAVKGAEPGDVLVVDIRRIELGSTGFMVAIPGEGAFGERLQESVTRVIPVKDGRFWFGDELSFPVHPMIGVIGVSPGDREVPCGEIGDHGGNLDAKVIRPGARVYFHVRQEGAMFALGDAHAGMGDGESLICGVEIPARVELTLDLIKHPSIVPPRPVVDVDGLFVTIGLGPTLDEAASCALNDMMDLIHWKTGRALDEISMLISAVGDLKVCQIVDPQKTARVEMPKSVLPEPSLPVLP